MGKTASRRRRRSSSTSSFFRSSWTWLGLGMVLILGGLAGLYLTNQANAPEVAAGESRADLAPDFSLVSLDDETLNLSDYRGQYVLVNFWATWCPPCRAELPDLVSYYHAYAEDGFVLLGVNEQEPASVASTFLQAQGLDFPVVLDSTGMVMNSYGASGLPSSFLINPEGQIVRMWTGMVNRSTLEREITPLLRG
jgi:peroxiredoxin